MARLTAALRSAGLTDRARFASGVTDVAALLALVDVLLVPAVRPRAAMPLAAAAQAMGKPVIVTATGALPELVMPAVTGWLLPADDPGEIAWALNLALKMGDDVRDRVARRAREFALTAFAAPAVLEQQLELYGDLLRPAGVPSSSWRRAPGGLSSTRPPPPSPTAARGPRADDGVDDPLDS